MSNIHKGIWCDVCNETSNIKGTRFACLVCPDYDLCENCHAGKRYSDQHRPNHLMQACITPWNKLMLGEHLDQELSYYCCPLCGDKDFSGSTLLEHCRQYHATNDDSVRCPVCIVHRVEGFNRRLLDEPLVQHLTNKHSKLRDIGCDFCHQIITNGSLFACLVCENYDLCQKCHEAKRYNNRHLSYHPMQMVPEQLRAGLGDGSRTMKNLRCPCCDDRDFDIQELIKHCQKYHGSQSHKVRCPVCVVLRGLNQKRLLDGSGILAHLMDFHHTQDAANQWGAQECAICIELMTENERVLNCGHSFHDRCISTWLETHGNCPICRLEQ